MFEEKTIQQIIYHFVKENLIKIVAIAIAFIVLNFISFF